MNEKEQQLSPEAEELAWNRTNHMKVLLFGSNTLLEASSLNQSRTGATIRAVTGIVKMRQKKKKEHSGVTETALHPAFDRLLCFSTKHKI